MLDRVPVNPGRVLITPENGAAAYYATMTRADNPTQEGTPLNKNSLLKDETAALFGLGPDAVPDNVLSLLSRFHKGLGNEYVWEKGSPQFVDGASYGGINILDPNLGTKMQSADSVAIDSSGNITLVNPQTVTASVDSIVSNPSLLRGKYIKTYAQPLRARRVLRYRGWHRDRP